MGIKSYQEPNKMTEFEILLTIWLAKYKAPKWFMPERLSRTKNGKSLRKTTCKTITWAISCKEVEEVVEYKARRSMLFIPSYKKKQCSKSKTVLLIQLFFDLVRFTRTKEVGKNYN